MTIAEASAIPKTPKQMREETEWWISEDKRKLVELEEEDNFSIGKFLYTHPNVAGVVSDIVTRHEHMMLLRCGILHYTGFLRRIEKIEQLIELLKSEHKDLKKAFEILHDLWNEQRFKNREYEIQMMHDYLNDISDTDKKDFIEIVKQAKRTKEGKLIMSDVSKKAMKKLPQGINGRKLDDKYCRILVIKWKDDIN